jgi:PadR family transcriptional regulator, regulatory protein PadR
MSKRTYLGEMELMVLLAVVRLGDDAYGVPISRELLSLAGREVALGVSTQRWTELNRRVL